MNSLAMFCAGACLLHLSSFGANLVWAHEAARSASVKVNKERQVTFTTNTGETTVFEPAPVRELGNKVLSQDPDTYRGAARHGSDVILFRLAGAEGARTFDEDGVVNIADHSYELMLDGDIKEADGTLSFNVKLKAPDVATKKNHGSEKIDSLAKRDATPLTLQLGIFVDKGFWDAYTTKYSGQAEAKINSFVMGMMDVMQSDYNGLSPKITLVSEIYEIWKTQPSFMTEAKTGGNVSIYLNDLVNSAYSPAKNNLVDHVMVLSGYGLVKSNTLGIAWVGTLCNAPAKSQSLMNTMGLIIGETAAHELGHSFGAYHDGRLGTSFESKCPTSGFLMAAYADDSAGDLLFSSCSRLRVQDTINKWNKNGVNCLLNAAKTVNCGDSKFFVQPCNQLKDYCQNDARVKANCKKTCGQCGTGTTTTTPAAATTTPAAATTTPAAATTTAATTTPATTTVPATNCQDVYPADCPYWKDDCAAGDKWMNENCKKTCNKCGTGTATTTAPTTNCQDVYPADCPYWKVFCASDAWVAENCKKSCNKC